jgi:CheY-like chemotaxis protein
VKTGWPPRSLTVLIVEHDADTRLYLRRCLRGMAVDRLQVHESLDDRAALLALDEAPRVDAVVAECEAPHHDGIAMVKRLRQHPAWRDLPVLIVSGEAAALDRARRLALHDSHVAVLEKPFNATTITDALRELIQVP